MTDRTEIANRGHEAPIFAFLLLVCCSEQNTERQTHDKYRRFRRFDNILRGKVRLIFVEANQMQKGYKKCEIKP